MIHFMPCRNPRRLFIHHAFTYYVGISSVLGTECGPALPFPPKRVLEVQWLQALSLVHEVTLIYKRTKNLNLHLHTQNNLMALLKFTWSEALVKRMFDNEEVLGLNHGFVQSNLLQHALYNPPRTLH